MQSTDSRGRTLKGPFTCQGCGEEYWRADGPRGGYCTRVCYHRSIVGRNDHRVEFICANCGETFLDWASQRRTTRTCCSKACADQVKTGAPLPLRSNVWKTCPTDGKRFKVGGKGERAYHVKFCSHACSVRFRYLNDRLCTMLTEQQAAYLAGFVDGEGCIGLYPTAASGVFLRVAVTNTCREILEWITEVTQIGHVGNFRRGGERTKPQWIWMCSSLPAESVLRQLHPFSIVKRQQMELALEFVEARDRIVEAGDIATQHEYRQRMAALNKRGPT